MASPPESRLQAARRGIEAVRQYLAAVGHGDWVVYAIRAEQRGGRWRLCIITQRGESMALTRGLALALQDLETLYLSGIIEAWIRPVDIKMDQPAASPVCQLEVSVMVRVGNHPGEAASLLSAPVDARDGALVRLTIAVPRPIQGWPR